MTTAAEGAPDEGGCLCRSDKYDSRHVGVVVGHPHSFGDSSRCAASAGTPSRHAQPTVDCACRSALLMEASADDLERGMRCVQVARLHWHPQLALDGPPPTDPSTDTRRPLQCSADAQFVDCPAVASNASLQLVAGTPAIQPGYAELNAVPPNASNGTRNFFACPFKVRPTGAPLVHNGHSTGAQLQEKACLPLQLDDWRGGFGYPGVQSADAPNCAPGYAGVLCGACERGFAQTVRAASGRLGALSVFPIKSHFVGGVCMGAQGA
jgi:hypothetical protein